MRIQPPRRIWTPTSVLAGRAGEDHIHESIAPEQGYSQEEIAREDLWADPYSSKDYGNWTNSYYEVMTMGIEGTFRTRERGDRRRPQALCVGDAGAPEGGAV